MAQGFFERLDDDRWVATQAAAGPWSPDAMHGGPPTALLGHVLAETLGEGLLARLTVDLLGPVPLGELTTTREVLRRGRRSALGRIGLHAGGRAVATAVGWVLPVRDVELPPDRPGGPVPLPTVPPLTDDAVPMGFDPGWEGYNRHTEVRFVEGDLRSPGDAAAWVRSPLPLVVGEPLDPLARVLLASDLGNGTSARLSLHDWLYANVDLTVQLRELPEGEWVGLRSATRFGPGGVATATSSLHGAQGPVGTALQTLFVDRR